MRSAPGRCRARAPGCARRVCARRMLERGGGAVKSFRGERAMHGVLDGPQEAARQRRCPPWRWAGCGRCSAAGKPRRMGAHSGDPRPAAVGGCERPEGAVRLCESRGLNEPLAGKQNGSAVLKSPRRFFSPLPCPVSAPKPLCSHQHPGTRLCRAGGTCWHRWSGVVLR